MCRTSYSVTKLCPRSAQTEPKDAYEWARVVAFGALGQRPPVRNEDFIADVARLVGGKKARIRALQARA